MNEWLAYNRSEIQMQWTTLYAEFCWAFISKNRSGWGVGVKSMMIESLTY